MPKGFPQAGFRWQRMESAIMRRRNGMQARCSRHVSRLMFVFGGIWSDATVRHKRMQAERAAVAPWAPVGSMLELADSHTAVMAYRCMSCVCVHLSLGCSGLSLNFKIMQALMKAAKRCL